jgi:Zn-dependent M16 (insulinase) family peptidase
MLIKQIDYDKREQIIAEIRKSIDEVLREGFDKEKLHSILDYLYFEAKDVEEPKGLARNINAMRTWNYGGDPLDGLTEDDQFAYLREAIDSDYYAELLKDFPCDDPETVTHYLLPSLTKGEEDYLAEKKCLEDAKNSWSEEETGKMIEMNEKLAVWQNSVDSLEALDSLPRLSLADISNEPEIMKTNVLDKEGVMVLKHKCMDRNIVHYHLYFSLADRDEEEYPAISFLSNLLGMIPTSTYSSMDLEKNIGRNLGFIDYNIKTFGSVENTDACQPYFVVSLSALEDREAEAIGLVGDILNNTLYSGEESKTMIKNILQQCVEMMRQEIMMSGNSYGAKRAQARFSSAGAATEMTEGFYFYQWMKAFAGNFEKTYESFVQTCEKVQKENFDADHLTVSVTSQREQDDISKIVQAFSGNEHADVCESTTLVYRNKAQKEAIQIPAGISYAVSAGNLKRLEQEYNCEMDVLATILSFDYLWNEVRVKGGAYGCGFSIGTTGEINFTSYRDPDPANSIEVYNNTSKYIRAFCNDEEPLDKYIISTAAFQEPLKQTRILAEYADADYFRGITYEDRAGMRSHILQMKKSDLLKYAELMYKISEEKTYCVIGNEQAISQCCDESWQIESI